MGQVNATFLPKGAFDTFFCLGGRYTKVWESTSFMKISSALVVPHMHGCYSAALCYTPLLQQCFAYKLIQVDFPFS